MNKNNISFLFYMDNSGSLELYRDILTDTDNSGSPELYTLPKEIIFKILLELPDKDIKNFSLINKHFYNIANDETLWFLRIQKTGYGSMKREETKDLPFDNYKTTYRVIHTCMIILKSINECQRILERINNH